MHPRRGGAARSRASSPPRSARYSGRVRPNKPGLPFASHPIVSKQDEPTSDRRHRKASSEHRETASCLVGPDTTGTKDRLLSDVAQPERGVRHTVDDLVSWLEATPGLAVSGSTTVTVGGLDGVQLDRQLSPAWNKTCFW